MVNNSSTVAALSKPRGAGLVTEITKVFESVGVLNHGSASSAATPPAGQAGTAGISNNALNVTRVGGLTAVIAAAGAAAIAIFNVNKATDKASIVVAAYVSVGVIIAAALLTAAIIISADIRSRTALNGSAPTAGPAPTAGQAIDAKPVDETWQHVLDKLEGALARLQHRTEDPVSAWLDACATSGITAQLQPVAAYAALHARLMAGQSRVLARFQQLLEEPNGSSPNKTVCHEIETVLDHMRQSLEACAPIGG